MLSDEKLQFARTNSSSGNPPLRALFTPEKSKSASPMVSLLIFKITVLLLANREEAKKKKNLGLNIFALKLTDLNLDTGLFIQTISAANKTTYNISQSCSVMPFFDLSLSIIISQFCLRKN